MGNLRGNASWLRREPFADIIHQFNTNTWTIWNYNVASLFLECLFCHLRFISLMIERWEFLDGKIRDRSV